jgi:3-oxoacyl-(acyl-carrier-protein) synthase
MTSQDDQPVHCQQQLIHGSSNASEHNTGTASAGPCIGMDTACSSSLVATHLAATGLANGEARTSVAAGVNLMLVPDTSIHMAALGALSPTGR